MSQWVDAARLTPVTDRLRNAGGSTALVSSGVSLEGAWGFTEQTRGMSAAYAPAAEECSDSRFRFINSLFTIV